MKNKFTVKLTVKFTFSLLLSMWPIYAADILPNSKLKTGNMLKASISQYGLQATWQLLAWPTSDDQTQGKTHCGRCDTKVISEPSLKITGKLNMKG